MDFLAIFTGAAVALITPMKEDGAVDFDRLKELVDWQISEGVDAIVACGTTGEASTLDDVEHIATIECVVKQTNGRVPVIAGVGSNNTKHGVHLTEEAERVGADALLHVTPYYNKASKQGLVAHYQELANHTTLPIILYSVASRTGLNIAPDVVAELKKIPNVVGIKEASGDISQIVEIARLVDDNFALYSGNDDQVLPILSVGGLGVISTISNLDPKGTSKMVHDYLAGDTKTALATQLKQKPLIDAIFHEVNPIPIKAAVGLTRNWKTSYRLPLCAATDETVALLQKKMAAYGLN